MVDAPVLVHPLACKCGCCGSYVHAGTAEDMARHLAQIVALEQMHGIRPLPAMPAGE